MKGLYDVAGSDGGEGAGGQVPAGVIVQEVEYLDLATIGRLPGVGVNLPGLIGQPGLEADEGALGALLGLRCDQAVALEDAPDGGGGRQPPLPPPMELDLERLFKRPPCPRLPCS